MDRKDTETQRETLAKYRACMEEIERRVGTINAILDRKFTTPYRETNVEFACFQLRKVLELIALASLVANKDEYAKQHRKFASEWKAKRILANLQRINPGFYPIPTVQVLDESTGRVVETKDRDNDYLTMSEFASIYSRCSDIVHANNPYGSGPSYDEVERLLPEWLQKVINLLNHHQVQLVDSDVMLFALMQSNTDGNVQVVRAERVATSGTETTP